MARKKGPKPMPAIAPAPEVKTKPLRVDIDPRLHRELRIQAAYLDLPMSDLVREILSDWITEKKKEGEA
jgi:hypothetical protein